MIVNSEERHPQAMRILVESSAGAAGYVGSEIIDHPLFPSFGHVRPP